MTELKYRRYVLIVDDGSIHKTLNEATLLDQLRKRDIALTLISAKDGAQASLKAVNQKFDAVILDTSVPRMVESGFATNFRQIKNTRDGHLYVVSADRIEDLPESLKTGRVFTKPFNAQEMIESLIEDLCVELSGSEATPKTPGVETRSAVDVRVINAVITSTLKVLAQFGVNDIKMEKPHVKATTEPLGGCISSVLDIVSQGFTGQLSISFDKQSYLELVSSMLCEEQTEINAENQDAVGEINNIIYGNAKSDLAQYGVAMTIPKVLHGDGQVLACPEGSAAMKVPFSTGKGRFFIEVLAFPKAAA